MIKATTRHGTYYLIDMENSLAKRVKAEGRNEMHDDNEWFVFRAVTSFNTESGSWDGPIEVGKAMFFILDKDNWRLSTTVVSIEEYDV